MTTILVPTTFCPTSTVTTVSQYFIELCAMTIKYPTPLVQVFPVFQTSTYLSRVGFLEYFNFQARREHIIIEIIS